MLIATHHSCDAGRNQKSIDYFPPLPALPSLRLNDLGAVLDALALIRLRLLQASQVCCDLTDELLVDALER